HDATHSQGWQDTLQLPCFSGLIPHSSTLLQGFHLFGNASATNILHPKRGVRAGEFQLHLPLRATPGRSREVAWCGRAAASSAWDAGAAPPRSPAVPPGAFRRFGPPAQRASPATPAGCVPGGAIEIPIRYPLKFLSPTRTSREGLLQ